MTLPNISRIFSWITEGSKFIPTCAGLKTSIYSNIGYWNLTNLNIIFLPFFFAEQNLWISILIFLCFSEWRLNMAFFSNINRLGEVFFIVKLFTITCYFQVSGSIKSIWEIILRLWISSEFWDWSDCRYGFGFGLTNGTSSGCKSGCKWIITV